MCTCPHGMRTCSLQPTLQPTYTQPSSQQGSAILRSSRKLRAIRLLANELLFSMDSIAIQQSVFHCFNLEYSSRLLNRLEEILD